MEFTNLPIAAPGSTAAKEIIVQKAQPATPAPERLSSAEITIYVLLALIVFMAPTWIAARGRRWSVGLVNVLLDWSLIGWVVALVMAVRSQENAKGGAK